MKKNIITLVNSKYLIDSPLVNFLKFKNITIAYSINDLNKILLSKFNSKEKIFPKNFYQKINDDLFANKIQRVDNFLR